MIQLVDQPSSQKQEKYLVIEGNKIEAVIIRQEGEEDLTDFSEVYSASEGELTEWTTKFINTLPDSSFAVVEPCADTNKNARHLPYKDANGKIDLSHLRNALARMNQIKSVCGGSDSELRAKARRVLIPLAKKYFPNSKFAEMSEDGEDVVSQIEGSSTTKESGDKMSEDFVKKEELSKVTEGLNAKIASIEAKINDMHKISESLVASIEKLAKPASEPAPKATLSEAKQEATEEEKLAELREKYFGHREPKVKLIALGPDYRGNMRYLDV